MPRYQPRHRSKAPRPPDPRRRLAQLSDEAIKARRARRDRLVSIVGSVIVLAGLTMFLALRAREQRRSSNDVSAAQLAGAAPRSTGPATTATTAPPPPSTTTPPPSITLAFGGNVHLEGAAGDAYDRNALGLLGAAAPSFQAADFAMVNLDTAIVQGTSTNAASGAWQAPEKLLPLLKGNGIDAVAMANRHALDIGPPNLAVAIAISRGYNLPVVGAGENDADAYAPYRTIIRGQRIAVLAANQSNEAGQAAWTAGPETPGLASATPADRLVVSVLRARATTDTLVVYLTWGTDKAICPSAAQRDLAHRLVVAGADLVVGSGAHRFQGFGRLDHSFVAYGLGNLVYSDADPAAAPSGVLEVTVAGRNVTRSRVVPITVADGVPQAASGPDADRMASGVAALRRCAGLGRLATSGQGQLVQAY